MLKDNVYKLSNISFVLNSEKFKPTYHTMINASMKECHIVCMFSIFLLYLFYLLHYFKLF